MQNKTKLFSILFLVMAVAVSGCGLNESLKPVANNNDDVHLVDSDVNEIANQNQSASSDVSDVDENQGAGAGEDEVVDEAEEVDTSDWLTYRNEEYGFEVRYPLYFKKMEIVGEFYNGQEYPRIGVSFYDPKTDKGTFQEVSLNIYDEGWIMLGTDLFDPQIFDFNKVAIKDVVELKNKKEFSNGEFIRINNFSILKVKKNYSLYLIFQNPENSKFLIFSTINNQESDEYKEINKYREKLMMEVLGTINFIKNSK